MLTATSATSQSRNRSQISRERALAMTTRLKEVDAVMVGMGWTGAILARELTKAGVNVVGLERGADRQPAEEFTLTRLRDELRYVVRLELMQDNSIDTITFRNTPDELALPIRRFGAFLPGEGVGGTGIHWGALHWRFLPTDFRVRTVLSDKYGAKAIPETMTIQDWPFSYDEVESCYDRFDKLCGVSGQAGNLRGRIVPGGNAFEGPRSDDYPNKPIKAGVAHRFAVRIADPRLRHNSPLRQAGQARDRRALYRHENGRRIRAACRPGRAFRLRVRQHAAAATRWHRRAL